MRQVTEKQMPAGGPAFDNGFALASEVEIAEYFKVQDTFTLKNSQAAKLAAIDALLHLTERTPQGFRSLKREEIAPVSTLWPEFIADLAGSFGVAALVFNRGAFLIEERVYVCHHDELGRGLETGCSRVLLPFIDGKVREGVPKAPCVLVSPDSTAFIWQPHGDLRKQRRVSFVELCELLGDMGEHFARFNMVAA